MFDDIKQIIGSLFDDSSNLEEKSAYNISIENKTKTRIDDFEEIDFSTNEFSVMMLTEILIENMRIQLNIFKRSIKVFKAKSKYFKDPLKNLNYRQKKKFITSLVKSQKENVHSKQKFVRVYF